MVAALAITLLAACSGDPASIGPPSTPTSIPSGTTPVPPPTPAQTSPARADPAPITLAFGGDVHFTRQLAPLLDHPDTALSTLRPYLASADIAMVNLETAITGRGTPAPKRFHFRAPPSALRALDAAGVDVASLANNHAVDYGQVGLRDTLAARRGSPIPIVGIGADRDQAYAPAYLQVRGSTVAVFGATQIPDWTLATWPAGADRPGVAVASSGPGLARLVQAVRTAARRADVVVVYLHWGTDYTSCPNSLQRSTARALSRAGADVVLGAHAHRVQGAGWLGGSYIGYGLGNFVWYGHNPEAGARTGVLTLTVQPTSGRVSRATWTPMRVTASGLPARQRGATGRRLLASWNEARDCTGLSATPPKLPAEAD